MSPAVFIDRTEISDVIERVEFVWSRPTVDGLRRVADALDAMTEPLHVFTINADMATLSLEQFQRIWWQLCMTPGQRRRAAKRLIREWKIDRQLRR